MRIQTTANGFAMCHKCAMRDYMKVSREYRPLVTQWRDYSEVVIADSSRVKCSICRGAI